MIWFGYGWSNGQSMVLLTQVLPYSVMDNSNAFKNLYISKHCPEISITYDSTQGFHEKIPVLVYKIFLLIFHFILFYNL